MKVKAKEKGYDGIQVRKPGEVFDVKDNVFDSHWMEPLEPVKAKAEPAKETEPEAPADPKQRAVKPKKV